MLVIYIFWKDVLFLVTMVLNFHLPMMTFMVFHGTSNVLQIILYASPASQQVRFHSTNESDKAIL